MAGTRAKRANLSKASEKAPDFDGDEAKLFIAELAKVLLNRRNVVWKASDVDWSLRKAIGSLPAGPVKSLLTDNVAEYSQALFDTLHSLYEAPSAQKVKRTRHAVPQEDLPATLLDRSYAAIAEPTIDTLAARVPANPRGIEKYVSKQLGLSDNPSSAALLEASRLASRIAGTLSGLIDSQVEAAAMFAVASSYLMRAACSTLPRYTDVLEASNYTISLLESSLQGLHIIQPMRTNGRWWLGYKTDENLVEMARKACGEVILVSVLALQEIGTAMESIHSHLGLTLKGLEPFGMIGVLEELSRRSTIYGACFPIIANAITCYDSTLYSSTELYLLKLLVLTSMPDDNWNKMCTVAPISVPTDFIDWLRSQPPSDVVLDALEAWQHGPDHFHQFLGTLNKHHLNALVLAAKREQVGGTIDETTTDDLLFFVSKDKDQGIEVQWQQQDDNGDEEEFTIDLDSDEGGNS